MTIGDSTTFLRISTLVPIFSMKRLIDTSQLKKETSQTVLIVYLAIQEREALQALAVVEAAAKSSTSFVTEIGKFR